MSQLPEPPPNIPRIVEVQDPGTGHYVVMVRMPTQLAAKFPDKPWGTEIDTIGLAKQDSDRFPGYTLVDVEPLKGSPDLYWIFQKLAGPVWTTKSKGQESLVPAKYRRLVTTTRSKQEVTPDTEPDTPSGNLVQSVVDQEAETGKALKVNTTEEIAEDASPLIGEQMIEYGIADTEESYVDEGSPAAEGFNVLRSSVDPIGNGKSIASKLTIDNFPILIGTDFIDRLNIPVRIEKQVVPAGTLGSINGLTVIEVQPLDKWRSIQITSRINNGNLPSSETFNRDVRYKFPDVLEGITYVIVGVSVADSITNSSASISFDIKEGASGSFTGRVLRTYSIGTPALGGAVWSPVPKGDSMLYALRHTEPFGLTSITRTITGGVNVPATLHAQIYPRTSMNYFGFELRSILFANFRFASNQTNFLPATAITDLPASNTEVLVDRNSERVRGDLWMTESIYLTIP